MTQANLTAKAETLTTEEIKAEMQKLSIKNQTDAEGIVYRTLFDALEQRMTYDALDDFLDQLDQDRIKANLSAATAQL